MVYSPIELKLLHHWSISEFMFSRYNISRGGELLVSENHGLTKKQLGGILRKLREEQGLTREWVSEHSDIGLRHLSAIELGEKNPSVDTLYRIIRSIRVSSDRVFYPELSEKSTDIDRIARLTATCTPKQRRLVIAFIEMLLEQKDIDF